jgi:hemin uptake protein HemP
MHKRLLTLLFFFTIILSKSYAQTAPVLISSSDSVGPNFVLLNIQFVPHDTGIIQAQVLMQQGTGHTVYDSTYNLISHNALSADTAIIYIGPLPLCGVYTLLFDMSNDSMQGIQYNPLDSVSIVCTALQPLPMDNFKVFTQGHLIEVESKQLPPNGVAVIYDINGRKITSERLQQPNQSIVLNAANSIYLLRIMSEGQMIYSSRLAMF